MNTFAGPPSLSGRKILAAVSRELGDLGLGMDRVQDDLSPALAAGLLAHPGAIAALQEIDRLGQTLRALSEVVGRMAEGADAGWQLSAVALLAEVPLADLARRLGEGLEVGEGRGAA